MKLSTDISATGDNYPSIAGGIGDILMTRLIFDTVGINPVIYYNEKITETYRDNNTDHTVFVCKLFSHLFGDKFKLFYHDDIRLFYYHFQYDFNIDCINLKKWFPVELEHIPTNEQYIVFHTKVRIDATMETFNNSTRGELARYFQEKKFNKRVVILGERSVDKNIEQQVHEQSNIYSELLMLTNHNDIIDMTVDHCYNSPNFETFIRDLSIIQNADHVYGCGWGGYFAMTWAVSENYSFYMPEQLNHKFITDIAEKKEGRICRHIDSFIKQMDKQ